MLNRHASAYSLLIHEATRTVFVLNPKVMSSFTRRLLRRGLRRFHGLGDPSGGRLALVGAARRFPIASLGSHLSVALRPRRYEAFAVVRDPYARLHSAWRDKILGGHLATPEGRDDGYPPSVRGRELAALRSFARKRGLPGGKPGTLVPFRTFAVWVASQPEGGRNVHWDSQHMVIQHQHFRFARIFRMEDEIDEAFVTVFSRIGFPPPWIRRQLLRPVNASPPTSEQIYDADTVSLVHQAFRRDFELFGYDPGRSPGSMRSAA